MLFKFSTLNRMLVGFSIENTVNIFSDILVRMRAQVRVISVLLKGKFLMLLVDFHTFEI